MSTLVLQHRDRRLDAVRGTTNINGIDFLEVASVDQRTLRVVFVHPIPGEAGAVPPAPAPHLTANNFMVEGGVRVTGVRVTSVSAANNELTLTLDRAGDFSTYTLRLVVSEFDSERPPAGFDPLLAFIEFRFKVNCPSDLDCADRSDEAPPSVPETSIDYLGKDYRSFRRLVLDRLSVIMPQYHERSAADIRMMLVELIAYAGDQLSYFQDAVATEAYLGTARQRSSLRRHARLLDYSLHQGCNARVWVQLMVAPAGGADGALLAEKTPLLTGWPGRPVVLPVEVANESVPAGVVWFESMHGQRLHAEHNTIAFHTWGGAVTCLPAGSTSAALSNNPARKLVPGDVLIFEQTRGLGHVDAPPDPEQRWAVRLQAVTPDEDPLTGEQILHVDWHPQDALPFELCLLAELTDGGTGLVAEVSTARGNVVLADHGRSFQGDADDPGLDPTGPVNGAPYRPRITKRNLTFAVSHDHRQEASASSLLRQNPRDARAGVSVHDRDDTWTVQPDLLASDRFATDFTVEVEQDGTAHLRFGDGQLGKRPGAGDQFTAGYRVGNGREGMLGAQSLQHIVTGLDGITSINNLLAAAGGVEPEPAEEVRRNAPQAFRTQQRAVTVDDWTRVAQAYPGVQKANTRFRWTRSWYTVFITVDRLGGLPVLRDRQFLKGLLSYLDRFRIAGYDLEIRGPAFVPLDIRLLICLAPGYFAADVKARLLEQFSSVAGTAGFFNPDNFTFGQPLYVSSLLARAMEIDGVASAQVLRLQRWGRTTAAELETGVLQPGPTEILRCDSNPSLPENGAIDFDVRGET